MDNKNEIVIAINPGSTTTKLGVWTREKCILDRSFQHDDLSAGTSLMERVEHRKHYLDDIIDQYCSSHSLVGVAGRGGLLKPLPGGTYQVSESMLSELKSELSNYHASNLGAFLADYYAQKYGVDSYIVDPVTVDEFDDLARISGVPWIERKSRAHALNIKAVSRRAAQQIGIDYSGARFVVAHLGGGTSIAAVKGGKIVDVNDAMLGMGPYSPQRAGALPIGPLIDRCYSGDVSQDDLIIELTKQAGIAGYCGTSDVPKVVEMAEDGDEKAKLALDAMMYQNAKEIGAMAAVLKGRVDAVIVTGGLAYSEKLMKELRKYIAFIATFLIFPGEDELRALAEGVFRVLDGEELVKLYGDSAQK